MNKLIAKLEAEKSDGCLDKHRARNAALSLSIQLIREAFEGKVLVPISELEDVCFAVENPEFIKAMSGEKIMAEGLRVLGSAVLKAQGVSDE